jgi:tetratricopeptide (TPR) repeat protein
MKGFYLLIITLCIQYTAKCQYVYEFNSTCQQAYKEIIQLKFNAAEPLIAKAKKQNNYNLIPLVLESYIDFFTLFFNEDAYEFKIRYPLFEQRIHELKKGPTNSPFYLFCLGAVYLHKAGVNIKFNNTSRAGLDFQVAFKYIKQNNAAFPTFMPNQLLFGALQTVAGTIPKGYQWIAGIFGIKGNISNGLKTLTAFLNSNDAWAKLMYNECAFMYCYLKFYIENKKDEALQFIQQKKLDVQKNYLFAYMAANLALNNKEIGYAEKILENRFTSPDYFNTPVWSFQWGFIHLYKLNTTEAINYFNHYLSNFKGNFYVKDIYQKISWCYYLQGKMKEAETAQQNCLKKGTTTTDADKQAYKDAKTNKWPNIILLKARILNDGGFNKEATALLQGKSNESFTTVAEKLEYNYRVGRINDDLEHYNDAIAFYLKAIAIGKDRTEYYAARAALQIGNIYEKQQKYSQAIQYYQMCLDMEDHDYKNSLDQRAKSGIERCKEKLNNH